MDHLDQARPVGAAASEAERYWRDVLDQLEGQMRDADDVVDGYDVGAVLAWQAPDGAPAIPASMLDRARAVLARQHDLAAALPAVIDQVGRQMQATNHFSTTGRRGSVYLDVNA